MIAEDLAKTIGSRIPNGQNLYVTQPPKTAFNQAFFNEILTALVNQGATVVKQASDADTSIEINTQLVRFGTDRTSYQTVGGPTALAATAWVIHEVGPAWTSGQVLAGAGALAVATDATKWFLSERASGPVPTHEMIVTITASDKKRYTARTSSVYYVADNNADLYMAASNPKTIQVVGDR